MATSHDFPSSVNSTATTVAETVEGGLVITSILKAGEVTIGSNNPITFTGPISFDSPIVCSSFTAPLGTVAYFKGYSLWTPLNIREELVAWYDPSDASTLSGIGAAGATMSDKSAHNNTLTVGGDDPTGLTTNEDTLNNLNVLTFGGAGDAFMAAPTDAAFSNSGAVSILVVAKLTDNFGAGRCLFSIDGTKDFQLQAEDGSHFRGKVASSALGAGPMTLSDATRNGPSIYEVYTDASDLGIVIDGSFPPADTANPNSDYNGNLNASQSFHLFTNRAKATTGLLKGLCGEVIALATGNANLRAACEGYLAHKWGLAGDLPSDHPFKNNPPAA